jgi:hypothetical protein
MNYKTIIFILLLFSGWVWKAAGQEINLNVDDKENKQVISVKLFDNNEGGFLLNLPLTFHLNKDNILFMIVGDENELGVNTAVWMFDKPTDLNIFLKQNKNTGVTKTFKKQVTRFERFYEQSDNIEQFALFDHGYETVQAAHKPVFFRIKDPSKPVLLRLKFYVTSGKSDGMKMFTSETGTVKITVNTQKK